MDSKSVMDYGNGWVNNITSISAAVMRGTHLKQTSDIRYTSLMTMLLSSLPMLAS
jgi:hypothetical protein